MTATDGWITELTSVYTIGFSSTFSCKIYSFILSSSRSLLVNNICYRLCYAGVGIVTELLGRTYWPKKRTVAIWIRKIFSIAGSLHKMSIDLKYSKSHVPQANYDKNVEALPSSQCHVTCIIVPISWHSVDIRVKTSSLGKHSN